MGILELKKKKILNKNSPEGLNHRMEMTKGRVSELEDRSTEVTQTEEEKGKGEKETIERLPQGHVEQHQRYNWSHRRKGRPGKKTYVKK